MAPQHKNSIRFEGRLWENLAYEPKIGWETANIAHRPEAGDGTYVIDLLGENGKKLTGASPDVEFIASCEPNGGVMRSAAVLAYLPLVAGSRELVFRTGDHVIHRMAVSKSPPVVRRIDMEQRAGGKIALSWEAEHPEGLPLFYTIAYWDGNKRGLAIRHGLAKKSTVIDTRRLPGGNKCRFGVLATDGVRSGFLFSNAVKIDDKKPEVSIVSPIDGTNFPPDQAITIRGQATDILGARIDAKNLIWQIDGSDTDRRSFSTTVKSLEPGRHKIALLYKKGGAVLAGASVTVTVVDRNKRQKHFQELLKELDARVSGGA